jgi:hypothetical protein
VASGLRLFPRTLAFGTVAGWEPEAADAGSRIPYVMRVIGTELYLVPADGGQRIRLPYTPQPR